MYRNTCPYTTLGVVSAGGRWPCEERVSDHHGNLGRIPDSEKRDVLSTVSKYRGRQVDCDLL